jgi:hypothetical protein
MSASEQLRRTVLALTVLLGFDYFSSTSYIPHIDCNIALVRTPSDMFK